MQRPRAAILFYGPGRCTRGVQAGVEGPAAAAARWWVVTPSQQRGQRPAGAEGRFSQSPRVRALPGRLARPREALVARPRTKSAGARPYFAPPARVRGMQGPSCSEDI